MFGNAFWHIHSFFYNLENNITNMFHFFCILNFVHSDWYWICQIRDIHKNVYSLLLLFSYNKQWRILTNSAPVGKHRQSNDWATGCLVWSSVLSWARYFSPLQSTHAPFQWVPVPSTQGAKLTTALHLMLRFRMSATIFLLLTPTPYAYNGVNKGKFTVAFTCR